jgi:hypothetical protein
MNRNLLMATTLAGSLAVAPFLWGPAQATPASTAQVTNTGLLTLIAEQGGGGGNASGGGASGASEHGNGGGGGPATASGGHTNGGPRAHVATGQDNGGPTGHQGMANNRGDDRHSMRDHDRDHGRTAARDNDNHGNDRHDRRHGHFVNGVWVWYGAPYASNDCGWIKHRAIVTGSPYWWSRYHECAY